MQCVGDASIRERIYILGSLRQSQSCYINTQQQQTKNSYSSLHSHTSPTKLLKQHSAYFAYSTSFQPKPLLKTPSITMSQSRGYRSTGIGGAGNFRAAPTASDSFFAAVSLRKREFTKFGIGGAGNYRRVDELALSSAPSISSDVSEARSTRSSYTIGIGGAGNVVNIADNKSTAERPSFSCKFFRLPG